MRDPILLDWVTEQIKKDREELTAYITSIFEAVQPWLNINMYSEIEQKKAQEKNKILGIAKVDNIEKVKTENAFDTFMKNLGINSENINGNR